MNVEPNKEYAIFQARCPNCNHDCEQLIKIPRNERNGILSATYTCCKCGAELGNGTFHTHRPHKIIDDPAKEVITK